MCSLHTCLYDNDLDNTYLSRIQVNDQIVEVDGISLVGVTQLFAATVLKNTKGTVKWVTQPADLRSALLGVFWVWCILL